MPQSLKRVLLPLPLFRRRTNEIGSWLSYKRRWTNVLQKFKIFGVINLTVAPMHIGEGQSEK